MMPDMLELDLLFDDDDESDPMEAPEEDSFEDAFGEEAEESEEE